MSSRDLTNGMDGRGFSDDRDELLALLLEEEGIEAPSNREILPREDRSADPPLSFSQQRLWFLDQLEPGSSFYNMPTALRITGSLDVDALERSFNEIVRRHEVLRATFPVKNGEPVQAAAPHLPVALRVVDSTRYRTTDTHGAGGIADAAPASETPEDAIRRAMDLISGEVRRPFDLAHGPLIRLALFRIGPREHILVMTTHHIVSDGWSMGIFVKELTALYRAFSAGEPSPLPELPIQYADFAVWQRGRLTGEALAGQLDYWKRQMAGAPPVLELPTDRPHPPVQTFEGRTERFHVGPELTEKLNGLGRQAGATLFMTLLAAFNVLLHRYSGQEDIVVGSPVANRNQAETEPLIGFFVNMPPFRADLSGDPSFMELLGRVKRMTLDAYAHQDIPFEQLVDALQTERRLSHSPLFQVMFVLQNAARSGLELPGLTIAPMDLDSDTARFDLSLWVQESAEDLRAEIEYNTALFDADTIKRMAGHFLTLLEGATADPHARISALPLLTEAERRLMLESWNDTRMDYPSDTCMHRLFEARAARAPERVALVHGDRELTYGELNAGANQLARHLRSMGVGPDVLVGVCVERSLELVVALLGVLKAGGAYVPLDPAFPPDRLALMLEDAQVAVLLTQEELLADLPPIGGRMVCLDRDWEDVSRWDDSNPETGPGVGSGAGPENLAYVIYTSGSTGRPKGVQIPHRPLTNFLISMAAEPGLTERDVLLAVTTISFDIAALEIYLPLIMGGRVVMASRDVAADGSRLLETLRECGATVMQATPAGWRLLLAAGWEGKHPLKILCGGEAFPRDLALQLLERGESVWNVYGPTETTIWSAVGRVTEAARTGGRAGEGKQDMPEPIGRPLGNTQIYVLDRNLRPVPIGVSGELHIGGDGLARGYLNRPDLTADRFVPDPFSSHPGARMYKTGDLVRYLPDGSIEFLGRMDHQVKVRGFRIELGEIETVLSGHPDVDQCVAIVREDRPGDQRLLACFIPRKGGNAPAAGDLRAFLKEKLPDYMTPSAFFSMEAFPLTPNGKINRRALPGPDAVGTGAGGAAGDATYVAPQNEVEQAIAAIWQDVLRLERVGVHDNFFDLGGHSFLVIQVHGKLRETLDADVTVLDLFRYPTVAALAGCIARKRGGGEERDVSGGIQIQDRAAKQKAAMDRQKQFMKRIRK